MTCQTMDKLGGNTDTEKLLPPAPSRFPTAVPTTQSPDHTSTRSTIESTSSVTPGNLPPIPQNQLAVATPALQRPSPGSSHESPTDPALPLTEFPPIHDRATPRPRRSPDPADQPSPIHHLPPIGCGFESHQAEPKKPSPRLLHAL